MTNLDLTDNEKATILSALRLVSPTGGGSEPYSLYRKLAGAWNAQWDDTIIRELGENVMTDLEECGAMRRT